MEVKPKPFSIMGALQFSFYTVFEHILFFLGLSLLWGAVMILAITVFAGISYLPFLSKVLPLVKGIDTTNLTSPEMIQTFARQLGAEAALGTLVFIVLTTVFAQYLTLGLVKITLEFYDYQTSRIKTLFSCFPLIWKGVIASTLYFLIVGVGFLLLIVPGIIFAIKYGFYKQAIVDKDAGIMESLRLSSQITYGAKWQLFGLWIVFLLINAIASSLFGIGLLITIPATWLAQAYVYRKLLALPATVKQ